MLNHKARLNVIVQGITGRQGSFHAKLMEDYGVNILAGVVPGKGGKTIFDIPVFDQVSQVTDLSKIDASVVFVPAPFCKAALIESVNAMIPLIVCITEGIPVHDFIEVKRLADRRGVTIIGPNSPGLLVPDKYKLGIIPSEISIAGSIAIVSRSGTLAYEVTYALSRNNIGQTAIYGIGGDSVKGLTFIDCLEQFESDKTVERIVLIGEIGNNDEQLAAEYIKNSVSKPVYAYVAGHHAPLYKQLGHAGAIIRSVEQTALRKSEMLEESGAIVAYSISELVQKIILG